MRVPAIPLVPVLIALGAGAADARDWNVLPGGGGDAPTIQAAVDSATAGDVVLLADGVFLGAGNRDVSFSGKAITVTSLSGAGATTIDCESQSRAFRFENAETATSVLSFVTIKRGLSTGNGGGIFVDDCSPTITGCVIDSCAAVNGGGIHVEATAGGSFVTMSFLEISNCAATVGGGGIHIQNASPTVELSTIRDCVANSGGGIFFTGVNAGPDILGNEIRGNTVPQSGGGIRGQVSAAGLDIDGNVIWGNSASNGGGMSLQAVDGTVENNTVTENTGTGLGSGIHIANGATTIQRTIIAFNEGVDSIHCTNANPTIVCCVIWNPLASDSFTCGSASLVTADPWFCGAPLPARDFRLRSDSPARADVSPCGELIGALDIGCGTSAVDPANWGEIKALYR